MPFNAGELVATIRLDGLPKYEQDVDRAGQKLTSAGQVASKLGKTVNSVLNGAAIATGALVTAGGLYVTSLFKTGVAYNQLQQQSRAALTSILGGSKAANEQMDKLDDFARNSPFAKDVFIMAQQQLLGFGMEAKKVIPTLDAVQDAVAATGGSSQQLGDIVFVLAQIQAAGKITGQDLMQLGQRGINAAELIGSQMGKTGQQIKEEITAGTLSADDALDALTKGMAAKFDGAAANVKKTFAGTVDRIRAASRDIGAALAEPFVAHDQGGLFVDWGNQVADVMRAVLAKTKPTVEYLTARAQPSFEKITKFLDDMKDAVDRFDVSDLDGAFARLEKYVPGLSALAGIFTVKFASSIPVLRNLVSGVNPLLGAIVGLVAASPELRSAFGDVLGAFEPLVPVTADLAKTVAGGLNVALPITASVIKVLADVATPLVDILAAIPTPVLAAVGGFLALNTGLKRLSPALGAVQLGMRNLFERMAVQQKLGEMAGSTSRFAGAMGVARIQAGKLGTALKTAFISNPIGIALMAATAGIAAFTAEVEKGVPTTTEMGNALRTTASTAKLLREASERGSTEKFFWGDYQDSLEDLPGLMDHAIDATDNWAVALNTSVNQKGAYDSLKRLGDAFADLANDDLPAAQNKFKDLADSQNLTKEQTLQLLKEMPGYREALIAVATEMGLTADDATLLALATGEIAPPMEESAESAKDNTEALAELRGGASDASGALSELSSALLSIGSTALSVRDAERQVAEALDSATKKINENGEATGNNTTKGRENNAALDNIAKSYITLISKMVDASASQNELTSKMEEGRKKFIEAAKAAGYTEKQAKDLADQLGLIPENIDIAINANTKDAQSKIDKFVNLNNGRSVKIHVTATGGETFKVGSKWVDSGYADGGFAKNGVKAFAAGGLEQPVAGLPSGFYKSPRPIYKFAEPETNGELFLSLKPSARSRNQALMQRFAPLLGMEARPVREFAEGGAVALSVRDSAVTVEPRVEVPPMQLTGQLFLDSGELLGTIRGVVRDETAPDADKEMMAAARRSRFGGFNG